MMEILDMFAERHSRKHYAGNFPETQQYASFVRTIWMRTCCREAFWTSGPDFEGRWSLLLPPQSGQIANTLVK